MRAKSMSASRHGAPYLRRICGLERPIAREVLTRAALSAADLLSGDIRATAATAARSWTRRGDMRLRQTLLIQWSIASVDRGHERRADSDDVDGD